MSDDLHREIVNLPCNEPNLDRTGVAQAYRLGHRDARHAAAELAVRHADTIAALTAERDRLRDMVANVQRVREHEHRRAENAIAERDDAFIQGMAAGQAAMPKGTLTVIDGPELEQAKARIAALTARAERAEAALAATRICLGNAMDAIRAMKGDTA